MEADWLYTFVAYFIQAERRNPDDAVSSEMRPASRGEFEDRGANAKTNVMEWCKDLLEIVPRSDSYQLCFVHRTFADFLRLRCTRNPSKTC